MSAGEATPAPISFVGALTVLFIGLKLTGHIDWSWWWCISPQGITGTLSVLAWIAEKDKQ
jgi:hypothetical protein